MTARASDDAVGNEVPPRSMPQLLLDPIFGRFILGKLFSTAGIWIHNIVAAVLAFDLTGSTFVVGLVSIAQFGPQLLFGPLSGALADRGDRRRQVTAGRMVSAAGSGGLALWVWIVGVDGLPGAWPVVLAAFVVGIGFVIGGPAMNALVPSMVRPGELAPAIALNSAPPTLARALGPAVGALVASSAGPATAFGLAAAGHFLFGVVVMSLPIGGRVHREPGEDPSVRAGLRHVRSDPALALLLVGVAAVGVGSDPAITLAPPLSASLGRGTALVGPLATSFGVGSGIAFFLLSPIGGRLGLERLSSIGLCLIAVGTALAALGDSAWLSIASFFIAGIGLTLALTSLSTQLQARLPEAMRGRVMALWAVAFLGSRPFAAGIDGAIADAASVEVALVVVSLSVLFAAWLCRPSRLRASA